MHKIFLFIGITVISLAMTGCATHNFPFIFN